MIKLVDGLTQTGYQVFIFHQFGILRNEKGPVFKPPKVYPSAELPSNLQISEQEKFILFFDEEACKSPALAGGKGAQLAHLTSAQKVVSTGDYQNNWSVFADLDWPPITKRIIYKIATICHRVVLGDASTYFSNLFSFHIPAWTLCSCSDPLKFIMPKVKWKLKMINPFQILPL